MLHLSRKKKEKFKFNPMNIDMASQIIKITIGTAVAILIAEAMGLRYATSAGIVTLLTIQATKKDTYSLAISRVLSFFVTMIVAFLMVTFVPGQALPFGIFMLFMVGISYIFSWKGAISINAVIGTHIILMEQGLNWELVINEATMVLIGIVLAIVCNLHMPSKEQEMKVDIDYIDNYMRRNLSYVADHLDNQAKLSKDREYLIVLIEHIEHAIEKAYINSHNTLKSHSNYYIEYLEARKQQCAIMVHFYYIVAHHNFIVEEASIVASVVRQVALSLDVQANTHYLRHKIDDVNHEILHGNMPKNADEFEGKAVLYQILNSLREFLWTQENFIEQVTEEQILAYWK